MKQAKQIFWNALLLTCASLVMRTVGVAFGVAVSNRAGAEVMGLYSLMSGVYGFALTVATSGIHFGVTRVIAETAGRGHTDRVGAILRRAAAYALTFGFLAALLLSLGANVIGRYWIKDVRTIPSLRLLAISLPLISLSSVFGGYFSAVRRTYKSATVQVLEQGAKVFFTMQLLALVSGDGAERLLCALVVGGVAAEVLSFLCNLPLFLWDKKRNFPKSARKSGIEEGRALIKITLPMALTTYLRSGLLTLQHILIPEGLRNSGTSHALSLAAYGSIHGMALPIILYPAAIISSFSGLLIPIMAECRVKNSKRRINYMISRVWSLALLFSIGVAGILICFSSEFGALLYPSTETGRYIRILAPLIPIMYIDTATDAILKGLGEQVFSMNVNVADALISVILVWLLIPHYGIQGYLITIYISECFNTVLSIHRLLCVTKTDTKPLKWVYKPLLCITLATLASNALLRALPAPTLSAGVLTLHCGITAVIYLLLLLISRSIDREDTAWIRTLFCRQEGDELQKEPAELPSFKRGGKRLGDP